jgi:hypothetical protein
MENTQAAREKIVAHLKDGEICKGYTRDFDGLRRSFHVYSSESPVARSCRIELDELKALFYVRCWKGRSGRVDRSYSFAQEGRPLGRRAAVRFRDGERIWGYVLDEEPGDAGFFMIPANTEDNNLKIFVIHSAMEEISYLPEEVEVSH